VCQTGYNIPQQLFFLSSSCLSCTLLHTALLLPCACLFSTVATNTPGQQVLTVSGVSQGLMYAACLLLMMPLGAGLRALAVQLLALAQKNKLKLPSIKLPFSLQT
jgi:hypothetical protein